MNGIPQFITNYNMYGDARRLVGVTGDVTLPNFEPVTQTISGAGIAGEVEVPVPGNFKSMSVEVPFRVIDPDMFTLASASGYISLTLRESQQINDISQGGVTQQGVRIEIRGMLKGLDLGKATAGGATDSKLTVEIAFIAIYIDNVEKIYLDKFNYICRVNGVDILAAARANI